MDVTVIIVTYANRFSLLNRVIEVCLKSGVNDIVVVDNNSDKSSVDQLKTMEREKPNMHIIWNSLNLGSAKAFKQGLQFAQKLPNSFIWLLDDDNQPEENALNNLKAFWVGKSNDVKCLLAYRPDREQYKNAIELDQQDLILGKKNSFSGFHIFDKLHKLFPIKMAKPNLERSGKIPYAPYGGMFFEKDLLETIGMPNEDLFLYADDHDWSYRITKKGYKIMLILDAVIQDIDTSWSVKNKGSYFRNIRTAPAIRVYYSIRNRMIFERDNLVTNQILYALNFWLFKFFMMIFNYRNSNYKVFLRAVRDAKTNNLAKY